MTADNCAAPEPNPKPQQRRISYRIGVGPDSALRVRIWKLAPGVPISRRPLPSQELRVVPREMSLGGLSVAIAGRGGQPIVIGRAERVRIEITHGDEQVLLDGRLRQPCTGPGSDGTVNTGIQFATRGLDRAGRDAIASVSRIVAALQREALRSRRPVAVAV